MSKDFIAPLSPDAPQSARKPSAKKLNRSLMTGRNYCAEPDCPVWLRQDQYTCRKHTPAGY